MAQDKLAAISIALSNEIGDTVSSLSANGAEYSASERLEAINRARGTIYTAKTEQYINNIEGFTKLYPEFRKEVEVTPTANVVTRAPEYKMVLNMNINGSINVRRLTNATLYDAIHNEDSPYYCTEDEPGYFESGNTIKIYGKTIANDDAVNVVFLLQLNDAVIGGDNPDIIEPIAWKDMIINEAYNAIRKTNLLR